MSVIIRFSKPIGGTPRVNPNVSYGLSVILMRQCRFSCNKCTTLVEHVDNKGGSVRVWGWEYTGISAPSSQFCCEPKLL